MNKELLDFLKSQKLITIASNKGDEFWVNNAYYCVDDELNLFFVSPKDTKHSQYIAENPSVAFNIAWYDEDNLGNRKAIQGLGKCKELTDVRQMTKYLRIHHKKYPIWKNRITYLNMKNKIIESRPYLIEPSYIKYWDDELFGSDGTKEFRF